MTDDRGLRTRRLYIVKNLSRWQGPWLPQSGMDEFALDREPEPSASEANRAATHPPM